MIDEHANDHVTLSEAGNARRDQMLHELIGEMNAVHQRRRTRRKVALAVAPLLIIALGISVWRAYSRPNAPSAPNQPIQIARDSTSSETPPDALDEQSLSVRIVRTELGIADRFRAVADPNVVRLDDAALLETLAQLNRPAGLIHSQGRTWLTADVADHGG